MSLHFFIDGYNFIQSNHALTRGTLDQQRERMLGWMESERPQGGNRVTVVFDGKPGRGWKGWKSGVIRVIFSEEKDADTVIKDSVDEMRNARDAVVVTDDRAIQKWVKGAGAKVIPCRDFFHGRGSRSVPSNEDRVLDADLARRINDELKRIWK